MAIGPPRLGFGPHPPLALQKQKLLEPPPLCRRACARSHAIVDQANLRQNRRLHNITRYRRHCRDIPTSPTPCTATAISNQQPHQPPQVGWLYELSTGFRCRRTLTAEKSSAPLQTSVRSCAQFYGHRRADNPLCPSVRSSSCSRSSW